jgi:hypothetical protein
MKLHPVDAGCRGVRRRFKLDPREIGWAPYVMIGGGFGLGMFVLAAAMFLKHASGRAPVAASAASACHLPGARQLSGNLDPILGRCSRA